MIICVVGPTAVGKTKLSVMLAKKYNGIIINADACQIYQELNIGTAKIKEAENEGVEHLLFDIKKPDEDYSVADYQKDLRNLLKQYQNRNIILVGGTGLYLKAGLYDFEFSEMEVKDYTNYSTEELYQMCLEINSDLVIDKFNRRRLENFLNRVKKEVREPNLLYQNVLFVGLTTTRELLYERINKRVEEMFLEGLVEEVKELIKKYGETKILTRAIGYKEVISYLNNTINLEEAKELIKKNSRHYAKRQYTYFNHQLPITWFNTDFANFANTYNEVIKYIDSSSEF